MNGQANEIVLCPSNDCSLFPYRMGKNPARRGIGNKNAIPPQKPN